MVQNVDVGMKCIKYMLFVANFMFVMIGFLLISIGSTIKAIYGDFEHFMASEYFSPATLTIVIGILIFFVAIFGCLGAIKESTCLINLFAFFLSLLLVLEIAASIAAYAMRGQIFAVVENKMNTSFAEYWNNNYDKHIWDFTQSRLYCCGVNGPEDWNDSTSLEQEITTPDPDLWTGPDSCCHHHSNECYKADVYTEGCVDALTYMVSQSALLLGCGVLAVSFIQILGIVFAHMLAKAVRSLKTQELVDRDLNSQRIYEQMAVGKDDNTTPVMYTPTFSEA